MKKFIQLILLFSVYQSAISGSGSTPTIHYVAQISTGVCTISTIQEAIDIAQPDDEIRIVKGNSAFVENLEINKNLTIKGGYTSCGLAQLDSRLDENRTIIDANNTENAIKVTGVGIVLNISGIWFKNGKNNGLDFGGGMTVLAPNSSIVLSHTRISHSTGINGGGIGIQAVNVELTLSNSLIDNNVAQSGGGIACINDNTINIIDDSAIFLNEARGLEDNTGFGGGIYARLCDINLTSGSDQEQEVYLQGISSNVSTNSGGGIYINNGTISSSDYSKVSTVAHNIANTNQDEFGDGGGLYMANGSIIFLHGLYFNGNIARSGNGGALYMDNSYYSSGTNSPNYETCLLAGNKSCNLFQNNKAIGDVFTRGGAIYLGNHSVPYEVLIMSRIQTNLRARFVNNRADGGSALAVYDDSYLIIKDSYFIGNGNNGADESSDFNLIRVGGAGSQIEVISSTLANNKNVYNFALFNGGQAQVLNSIIYEEETSNTVLFPVLSEDFSFDCSLFHEGDSIGSFDMENHSLITTNPGFIDSENNDYHISASSPAVDRCHRENINSDYNMMMDYDLNNRPQDSLNVDNGIHMGIERIYDAGADEMNELIFKNGFEQ